MVRRRRKRRIRLRQYALAGVLLSLLSSAAAQQWPTLSVFGDGISAAYGMAEDKGWVALLREVADPNGAAMRRAGDAATPGG